MLDINSHGIDGTDEDKAKWWEEERNVFRGRADSFIARMHLVQGDRRFSKWKGSVVDSVVGVFLTQNVSDHLSSSAFMSLAARFPPKSDSTCKTYNGEGTSLVVNKPQMHIVEPEENTEWDVKLLSQSVYDQSSMTIDIAEHSGEKEAVNSNDSCRTTSSVISLSDESNCRLSESSQRNINEHHSPMRSGVISSSVVSSQISRDLSNDQNPEKIGSCSDSNSEVGDLSSTARYNIFNCHTSFSKLLEMVSSTKFNEVNSQGSKSSEKSRDSYDQSIGMKHDNPTESLKISNVTQGSLEESIIPSHEYSLKLTHNPGVLEVNCSDSFKAEASPRAFLKNKDENDMNRPSCQTAQSAGQVAITHSQTIASQAHPQEQSNNMQQSIFNISGQTQDLMQKERGQILVTTKTLLRIKAQAKAGKREKTENTMDSLDWDAVRCADVSEIANAIKERGMNNRLAERIKNFLNRLVEEHGSIDLEWLRDVPPDQTKEYLLSIRGLGLKSVECVRLLTLHHLAFPNSRRHWKYYGWKFSARLALPGPEQRSIVSTAGNSVTDQNPSLIISQLQLPLPENTNQAEEIQQTEVSRQLEPKSEMNTCQPIIEEPTTPEPECSELAQIDIEDAFYEDSCEIPTIKLNIEEFTLNLQNYMQENMELQEGEMSKALVALNPQAASIPTPKLKNVSRLRTEHCVYELPDTHPLLEGWDTREPDDPRQIPSSHMDSSTISETANSIQPPESKCSSYEECGQLCNDKECFSCNSFREANSQIVRGTLLIPCRTAMRGSFPLNGTYFQVNEVFADHDSSLNPISVPRSWIWNLNRRTVYFGTSIPTIFKGLSTQDIQQCFWRGKI
ncbi:Permuted single zf-CXXC unit [Sesbania bispinosa]|nr:Permuted single zf-CXXC unit [Sesbania bispinosa]